MQQLSGGEPKASRVQDFRVQVFKVQVFGVWGLRVLRFKVIEGSFRERERCP